MRHALCAMRYIGVDMSEPKPFNFQDYLAIGLRRKWYVIIPLMLSIIVSFAIYKYLPKIYKATTLILVQPQRVPENYVHPTLTESVGERLNTISQEILSRTRLERVINEFNLYIDMLPKLHMEEIIEIMRQHIEIKVPRPNAFSVSFEGEDPRTVMLITNKLASLFIEENLKLRETQAEGTSEFISRELQMMEENLRKKENELRFFKERNMGQLPQQLEANLRILERLQQQFKTTSDNLKAAEDRIVSLQNQIEQVKERQQYERELSSTPQSPQRGVTPREDNRREQIYEDPLVIQLNTLKRDLANMQTRYKENHPDVIDLKRKIASVEPKVMELLKKQIELTEQQEKTIAETNLSTPGPILDPATESRLIQYREQFNETRSETKRLREEMKILKEQIALYQRRVEDTPRKEEEIVHLTRDYDLIKNNYLSLLDKKIAAQMAENLERKQQGEQFKILDPARLPEKPSKPDRNKILLMGSVIGLVAGLGLAWFRESLDQSFHSVSDLEDYLGIPVVATIPNLNKGEKKAA
jgi:polysaccharide chain length determinant protein (PEP-CTERM system associated)